MTFPGEKNRNPASGSQLFETTRIYLQNVKSFEDVKSSMNGWASHSLDDAFCFFRKNYWTSYHNNMLLSQQRKNLSEKVSKRHRKEGRKRTYSAIKLLNSGDQSIGFFSLGGGFLGMWKRALIGCRLERGGSPSPSSMAVIPSDQTSHRESYEYSNCLSQAITSCCQWEKNHSVHHHYHLFNKKKYLSKTKIVHLRNGLFERLCVKTLTGAIQ